jgi:hypothetical protein
MAIDGGFALNPDLCPGFELPRKRTSDLVV